MRGRDGRRGQRGPRGPEVTFSKLCTLFDKITVVGHHRYFPWVIEFVL